MIKVQGWFTVEQWRDDKLLKEFVVQNGITLGGKDDLLDVYFTNGTQITSWYCGLLDTGYSVADDTDIMSDAAAAEFTEYTVPVADATNRADWSPGTQQVENVSGTNYVYIENATLMEFTITGLGGAQDVYGAFIGSTQAKGATTGILWSTAAFTAGDLTVINTDVVKIKYKVRIPY